MADLERLTDLELVPVVEVTAWSFSERPMPEGPSRAHPDAWLRYWLDCLADAGVTGLSPIKPGSMNVAVGQFTNLGNLARILDRIVGSEALVAPDGPGALSGGFAVVTGGRVLIEPNCCCDLANWKDWQRAADCRETQWEMLWIGHPWLSVRSVGDDLILSKPHESSEPVPAWIFDRNLIAPALATARSELECFAQRLAQSLLAAGNVPDAVGVARTLAGLPREETTSE